MRVGSRFRLSRVAGLAILCLWVNALWASPQDALPRAGSGPKKSDAVVKINAAADKADAEGKQIVNLTLDIDKDWYVYGNPLPKEFSGVPTTVTLASPANAELKVDYPEGKLVKDPDGDYAIYEKKAVIKATVKRAKGDSKPLELNVKIQSCSKTTCLMPATVKVTPAP